MSECEIPAFYVTSDRAARKQHKCCECVAPINRGEIYLRIGAKWDGEIHSYAQHQLCAQACMYVRDNIALECLFFGGLKDFLSDDWEWKNRYDHRPFRNMVAAIYKRERRARREPKR